jgi:hypothetical protein
MVSIMLCVDLSNSQSSISPTTGRGTDNEVNKDDEDYNEDDDRDDDDDSEDDEAMEANKAVARADADTANLELAQLATEKVNAKEKRLVVLKERKGKKILSAVWQDGTFRIALLVNDWKGKAKRWGNFLLLLLSRFL